MNIAAKRLRQTFDSFLKKLEKPFKYVDDLEPITAAIMQKELDDVKSIWKEENRFYRHQDTGLSYLHMAVMKGDLDIVKCLIEAGMDVNDTAYTLSNNRYRNLSCLHIAIGFKHKHLLNYLRTSGCDIDCPVNFNKARNFSIFNGMTPLHFATFLNDLSTVQLLLEWKVLINVQAYQGLTALHVAASLNFEEIAEILLKRNVLKDVRMSDGATPVLLAAQNDSHKVLNLLLQHGHKADLATPSGYTAVHAAAENGAVDSLIILCKAGCNLNCTAHKTDLAKTGKTALRDATPLHLAVVAGKRYCVETLLKFGADPNIPAAGHVSGREKDVTNIAPLFTATLLRSEIISKMLLNYGADIDTQNSKNMTPLMLCASENNLKVGKILLEHGADVDVNNGAPLFTAVRKKHLDFCDLLLRQPGIQVDLVGTYGDSQMDLTDSKSDPLPSNAMACKMTPLHVAVDLGMKDLVKKLIDHGADVNTKFSVIAEEVPSISLMHSAVAGKDVEDDTSLLYILWEAGCAIDDKMLDGRTPLCFTVERNRINQVNFFLNHGADVNTQGGLKKRTCLTEAVVESAFDMVALLIKNGANPNIQDVDGYTALHCAMKAGNKEIILHLLDHGHCDVNLQTNRSPEEPWMSALGFAIEELSLDRLDEVGERLLELGADPMATCLQAGSTKEMTPLHLAAKYGLNSIIRKLLRYGADLNVVAGETTPLAIALKNNKPESAELLIRKGAKLIPDVDGVEILKGNSFHVAVEAGVTDILALLADFSADIFSVLPNDADEKRTPLGIACVQNAERVTRLIRKILEIGADVNMRCFCTKRDDVPPLIAAISHSTDRAVKELIRNGADPDAYLDQSDKKGDIAALDFMTEKGNVSMIRLLLKAGADVRGLITKERGMVGILPVDTDVSPLRDVVQLLCNFGIDIRETHEMGFNVLHHMTGDDILESDIEHLMKIGADTAQVGSFGDYLNVTPLHALIGDDLDDFFATEMLRGAPDINLLCTVNGEEMTALMLSCLHDDDDLARKLLRHGADANIQIPKTGETALHLSIDEDKGATFLVLLEAGCDINVPTKLGITPLILATQCGDIEMTRMLIGADCGVLETCQTREPREGDDGKGFCTGATALHQASELGELKITKMLLEAGAQTEAREIHKDSPGFTPLHCAVIKGDQGSVYQEIVKVLVEAKCDINAQTDDGLTALHLSVQQDNVEMARLLNALGANPMIKTKSGQLASALALRMQFTEELINNQTVWNYHHNRPSLLRGRLSLHQRLSMQNLGLWGRSETADVNEVPDGKVEEAHEGRSEKDGNVEDPDNLEYVTEEE
ncbi:ankyrin-2-like [Lineus longissimus]|uniref:ankyrin-2-like n=1 Tax=Lineus longissimus TaxID=88925 RepID=UPI002B4D8936